MPGYMPTRSSFIMLRSLRLASKDGLPQPCATIAVFGGMRTYRGGGVLMFLGGIMSKK